MNIKHKKQHKQKQANANKETTTQKLSKNTKH